MRISGRWAPHGSFVSRARCGAQRCFERIDGGTDVGCKLGERNYIAIGLGEAARHADSVVLLAGYVDANQLWQEAGVDGL